MHEGWDSGGICARGWSSGQLRLWLRVRTHSSPRVSGYSQEHSKRAKEHGGCSQTPFLRCNKQTETTGVWEQRRLRSAHTSTPLPTPGAEGEVCVHTVRSQVSNLISPPPQEAPGKLNPPFWESQTGIFKASRGLFGRQNVLRNVAKTQRFVPKCQI